MTPSNKLFSYIRFRIIIEMFGLINGMIFSRKTQSAFQSESKPHEMQNKTWNEKITNSLVIMLPTFLTIQHWAASTLIHMSYTSKRPVILVTQNKNLHQFSKTTLFIKEDRLKREMSYKRWRMDRDKTWQMTKRSTNGRAYIKA